MRKSTGPTYTRFSCCTAKACSKFESMWDVGECYEEEGRAVRDCSKCGEASDVELLIASC